MKTPNIYSSSNRPKDTRFEEGQLVAIFQKFDVNRDGLICNYDLTQALEKYLADRVYPPQPIKHWIKNGFNGGKSKLTFKEFSNYMMDHDDKLWEAFNDLDINQDGYLDVQDLVLGFHKFGITITCPEAIQLIKTITNNSNDMHITYTQWQEYWIYHPNPHITEILPQWRHLLYVDVGEDTTVPDDFTDREMKSGMWWRHLVAGGIAGMVSRTCTAPLDRIKVFFQVRERDFKNIYSCFRHMVNEGGFKSLWRGNGTNVFKIAPETAIKFAAYEQVKRALHSNSDRELQMWERCLAGSIAGIVSQSTVYPLEVLKTRLCIRKTGEFKGIMDAANKIYQREGLRSFYRGFVPNLLGIIPYAGLDLALYETLKKTYNSYYDIHPDQNPGIITLLACGTVSSTCGQLASYPLALVRTRLQAAPKSNGKPDLNLVGIFRGIIREEGYVGLYRGITANFLKVAPAVSISYVVYEQSREWLGVTMT